MLCCTMCLHIPGTLSCNGAIWRHDKDRARAGFVHVLRFTVAVVAAAFSGGGWCGRRAAGLGALHLLELCLQVLHLGLKRRDLAGLSLLPAWLGGQVEVKLALV